ncbi:MAG: DUF4402 domain-containing protein [Sphingomicrobium sp.]
MKKLLVSASALVALAVTATPAYAVPATSDATATVRVLRPLTLTSEQDLNLQTVVLSGAAPFAATVGVDQDGAPSCSATVTCSGTMTPAIYRVTGANNQIVKIDVDSHARAREHQRHGGFRPHPQRRRSGKCRPG